MLSWEEADKILRRKGPPRRKAPGPATPAFPSPAEVLAIPLLDALCDRDEPHRQARPYGHEVGNLRCPGYFNITIMAATFTKARKLAAFFS